MLNKDSLYLIFIEESREILAALEADLLDLEQHMHDSELVNKIFRSVHTLKGSSGMVEFTTLTDFSHEFENVLARVRSGDLKVNQKLISIFLEATDVLKQLVESPSGRISTDLQLITKRNADTLKKYQGIEPVESSGVQSPADVRESFSEKHINIVMKFRPDIFMTGTDPMLLLKELVDQGSIVKIRCDTSALPDIATIQHDKLYLSWELILKTMKPLSAIENVFIFVRDENTIVLEDISAHFRDGVDLRYADKKLGEILEEEGIMDAQDVEEAIRDQKRAGEILVEKKKVDSDVLDDVLKRQQRSKELNLSSTIRVDTGKLDKLVNLVGEMVIGVARMSQLLASSELSHNRDTNDTIDSLERISRDVQEQVMRVRMIPIEATFRRFQRVVRDVAKDLGKKINLYIAGSETELDKTVIEKIDDPLKHLIRNSVDHGIEMPEERLRKGKPIEGSIWLRAYQQEGKIIVEVEDDGAGIDRDKVLRKAAEAGLYKGGDISDSEVFSFIMMPGFSTAAKVTEISGRGVGLDVVKRNIESLRGNIEIFSERGVGTLFRVKLPLTLAIIEGMKVSVGSEILTIPLLSIVEAVRPSIDSIKTIEGRGELMEFRGEYLPLIRLYEILHFETDIRNPEDSVIMIIEGSTRKLALMVDDVIGQQQAVIKSLDTNYRQIEGTSGATILGDGRISIILDVHGIENLAFGRLRTGRSES